MCIIPASTHTPEWDYDFPDGITKFYSYFLNELNFSFQTNWFIPFASMLGHQKMVQSSSKPEFNRRKYEKASSWCLDLIRL